MTVDGRISSMALVEASRTFSAGPGPLRRLHEPLYREDLRAYDERHEAGGVHHLGRTVRRPTASMPTSSTSLPCSAGSLPHVCTIRTPSTTWSRRR